MVAPLLDTVRFIHFLELFRQLYPQLAAYRRLSLSKQPRPSSFVFSLHVRMAEHFAK